jgi:spermidine dehydrogenase
MAEFGDRSLDRGDGITRRDFLDGVAITAAGLAAAAAAPDLTGAEAAARAAGHGNGGPGPLPAGYYPPTRTGLKGQRDRFVRQIMRIDGPPNQRDVHSARPGPGIHVHRVIDDHETYDCVIVGAGASGLAAAKYYRDRFGEDSRILLLDALEDYGGHSTRNEFHVPNAAAGGADLMLLRNGGTVNLDSVSTWNQTTGGLLDIPGSYGQPALDLLAYLGVDPFNFPDTDTPGIPASFGLRPMLLFPSEDWGSDTLIRNRLSTQPWPEFLAGTPLSPEAQAGVARIQTDETTDWIALKHGPKTDQEKKAILSRLTQKRYYMEYIGVPEESIVFYQRNGHSLLGAGAQAVSAGDMWALGAPGFEGLGLNFDHFPGIGRTPQFGLLDTGPSPTWPDGNSSLLRLLLSRLIPDAVPDVDGGRPNQENVVKAVTDYSQLDRRRNDVRIRLKSLVFRVEAARDGHGRHGRHGRRKRHLAEVDYLVRGERFGRRVRARHVVMACWNRVTAHVVEDLPRQQVKDLCYARKVPLIYGRAALNNWQAFADAQVASVSPRGNSLFWDSTSLSAGARFGSAYGPTPNEPPSAPASLSFTVVPTDHDATPQLAAYEGGRKRLLQMSFADLEGALIDVLDRSVNASGGDFEPERDIHSIMMNRWNYGYAHELTSVWDPSLYGPVADQPQVRGRAPFRNVAIANSDSAAFAYTHSAINEGYRAVQDLPGP